ncbi:hypothetical protein ACH3VR_12340 [Microbacterium sp. B2969]|uniref:Uncharacterized protein n=1 Tax=Microbacterium alkaliflavum TaxID=3248839 RepID=A0ABW7Q8F1_9MICO
MAPRDGADQEKTSKLTVVIQFPAQTEPWQFSGAVLLQGRLARAHRTCDVGQSSEVSFNDFTELQKTITFSLLRRASPEEATTNNLELAERASGLAFTRVQFSKDFDPPTGSQTTQSLWMNCVMSTEEIWNRAQSAFWDLETPIVGVAASAPAIDTDAIDLDINSRINVQRGDSLYYQEGYPAPSSRDQTKDSFAKSTAGWAGSPDSLSGINDAIIARYSDTIAESERNSTVFFAGVLAGLFASFLAVGIGGLLDELIGFRPLVEVAASSATAPVMPATPAPTTRWGRLKVRLRRLGKPRGKP